LTVLNSEFYMGTFSMQRSFWGDWLAEAAYVGSQGGRLSKRENAHANATPGVLYDVTPGVVTRYPQLNRCCTHRRLAGLSFTA
jgi:hypothetical protein